MKLYTFEAAGQAWLGAEVGGRLVDLAAAHAASGPEAPFPAGMLAFLQAGPAALADARRALAFAAGRAEAGHGPPLAYDFDGVRLLAPIPRPGKILCSGINYRGHLAENPAAQLPQEPFFFAKLPSTVIGPGQPIVKPRLTGQLDYEVELAVVIGRRLHGAGEAEALAAVFGYTILHDVSARDVQFKDNQITLGKNFDTFTPLGPCIVTADELPNLADLRLRSYVNGRLMQDGSTADWVFPLPRLLSFLSQVMTLEPGDVVTTGTPAGVGLFRQPPLFLQPGDVVTLEIEGIGRLENPVVAAE